MKKYISIILAGATLLALTACGDEFLTVENPTAEPVEEYFTTPEHLAQALVAAYDPLEWTDWSCGAYNPVNIMSDIMADQLWVGGSDRTDNQFWHLMANYEALPTNTMTALWTEAYSGVKRCNDLLAYIPNTKGLTDTQAKEYEAQGRILRVFYYNWLWKFYGNIPYYEKNLEDPFVCPQFTADEVYAKMIADLEGALALCDLPMKRTGDETGYVTMAMAYMLYAEVVMYQNDESRLGKAFDYMKAIIDSGQYSLWADYTTLFRPEAEWCSETIFDINYFDDQAYRSWSYPMNVGGTVIPRLLGPSGWTDGTDGHDNGWGFAPVRTSTVQMFAAGDKRKDATCWHASAVGTYNARYQDTGYFLEKYVGHTGDNAGQIADADLNYNVNLRVYRYAETLLNAAELVATGHGAGDADGWLNEVHHRSGLTDNVTATLANIKKERQLEFVGEGKRYWDLIRWGDAETVLVPVGDEGFTKDNKTTDGRTNGWSQSKKYLPIPQSEIDATAGTPQPLKQNNY